MPAIIHAADDASPWLLEGLVRLNLELLATRTDFLPSGTRSSPLDIFRPSFFFLRVNSRNVCLLHFVPQYPKQPGYL